MAFTYIGDNSHDNTLSRTKYNYLIMLPTLTANCLYMKVSINFSLYILQVESWKHSLLIFNWASNKRLLDAAGVLDNSHNSAHNAVWLLVLLQTLL